MTEREPLLYATAHLYRAAMAAHLALTDVALRAGMDALGDWDPSGCDACRESIEATGDWCEEHGPPQSKAGRYTTSIIGAGQELHVALELAREAAAEAGYDLPFGGGEEGRVLTRDTEYDDESPEEIFESVYQKVRVADLLRPDPFADGD